MDRLLRYAMLALALLLMVPALLMLADAWAWLMLGHTFSGIPWDEESGMRPLFAWVLLLAGVACLIGVPFARES